MVLNACGSGEAETAGPPDKGGGTERKQDDGRGEHERNRAPPRRLRHRPNSPIGIAKALPLRLQGAGRRSLTAPAKTRRPSSGQIGKAGEFTSVRCFQQSGGVG